MSPELKNSPDSTAQKQADYARQLEAEKKQASSSPPAPINPPPQPRAQESTEEEPSNENEPVNLSYPPSDKQEQANWARNFEQNLEKAKKEYAQKMVKEGVKQAAKKGWQWFLGLLRSASGAIIAALGTVSLWVWLIIGIIIIVGVLLAALVLYAKNDPCGFRSDAGAFWAAQFFVLIGETGSIVKVCK